MTQSKRQYPTWMLHEDGNPDAEIAAKFDAERDELIKHIETAFANVRMPRYGTVAINYDSYMAGFGDMNGINRDFGDKSWQDIPLETLARYSDNLSVFTPAGFHHYLPAMMIAVLNHFYTSEFLPDRLPEIFSGISALHPFNKTKHSFKKNQAEALVAYFQFLKKWWDMFEDVLHGTYTVTRAIEFWQSELNRLGD